MVGRCGRSWQQALVQIDSPQRRESARKFDQGQGVQNGLVQDQKANASTERGDDALKEGVAQVQFKVGFAVVEVLQRYGYLLNVNRFERRCVPQWREGRLKDPQG